MDISGIEVAPFIEHPSLAKKYIATIQTKVDAEELLIGASGMGHTPAKAHIFVWKDKRPEFLERYFHGGGNVLWEK
jgi:hypothetical protein